MNTTLIINLNTSTSRLTQARDALLFMACWAMWVTVFVALFNGAGIAFPHMYLFGLVVLMSSCLLWSVVHIMHAPQLRRASCTPLTLESLAKHFNLASELIGGMQKERTVVVFHSQDGDVTDLRSKMRRYGSMGDYSYVEPLRLAA